RVQQLGAQAVAAGVLEVGGEQVVDEELAVAAALAELDLDEDFRGVVKDGPSPRARPGRAGPAGQSHLRCRFFLLLMVTGSFGNRSTGRRVTGPPGVGARGAQSGRRTPPLEGSRRRRFSRRCWTPRAGTEAPSGVAFQSTRKAVADSGHRPDDNTP